MTSSTLLFRYLIISLILVFFIELIIHISFSNNYDQYPPNFFEYAPLKNTNRAKLIIAEKINQIKENNSDIVQVGGSSGLHGINPLLLQGKLGGYSFYNLSCCRNSGFTGYRHLAQIAIEKNPNLKAVILYLSPFSLPTKKGPYIDTKLSKSIYKEYISRKRYINNIPSNRIRRYVTNTIFNRNLNNKIYLDETMTLDGLESYSKIVTLLNNNLGWLPFNRRSTIKSPSSDYISRLKSGMAFKGFERQLMLMQKLFEKHEVKLILAFAPVPHAEPSHMSKHITDGIEEKLYSFSKKYNNVFLLTPFYTEFKDNTLFGDNIHLSPEGSIKASHRLAKALGEITELL